jgi:arabinan endo-1,5-alpha-L-arabinosidase
LRLARRIAAGLAGILLLAPVPAPLLPAQEPASGQPQAYSLSGDFWGTHDPSIAKDGKTYYVFATGKTAQGGQFAIRCSEDLRHWKLCGQVFNEIPEWIHKDSPGTVDLWAPDISYHNGQYQLYYAYSLFGKNTSGIALATNRTLDPKSPDYKWEDRGLVLKSTAQDNYNAIDPNFATDGHGGSWLAFGSFWSGIKLVKLDGATGKPPAGKLQLYSIAARKQPAGAPPAKPGLPPDWEAVEAPFIVHHGGYFYLFVSWDLCCRGVKSTYRTMVGRAPRITGPYLDKQGVSMAAGGGTELLVANSRWLGPGGESALMQPAGDILVFHAYDAKTGRPALQVSTLVWKNGWPEAALGK